MEGDKPNLSNVRGSLWGAVLGDVIGAFLEFNHSIDEEKVEAAFQIKGGGMHKLEPGQPTDDSELAYSVGKGLIAGKGKLNLNLIAMEMGHWFQSKPIDVGTTIRKSVPKSCNMKEHQAHLVRKGARQNSQKSQSNGTLMAITPLSNWCLRLNSKDLLRAVRQYTILIHPNELVYLTNGFYTLALCYLLKNAQNEKRNVEAFEYAKNQINIALQKSQSAPEFKSWIATIQKSLKNPEIIQEQSPPTKKAGWVRVAFTLAFHQLLVGKSFRESIKSILKKKGDTDTNACIAGGLLGAYYGIDGLKLEKQMSVIEGWRPKRVNRPEWLVPGLVVQKLGQKIVQCAPTELQIVGSEESYQRKSVGEKK